MRIALFTPYFPAPALSGGRIRIEQFARALARRAELHVFAQASSREARESRASADMSLYAGVHVAAAGVTLPWTRDPRPMRVRRGSPARLARLFRARHAESPFDLLVVEHCHAAAVALESGLPWVLDEHNIESQYLGEKLRAARGPAGLRARDQRELARMCEWESRCWRSANEVVAVTEEDAAKISAQRARPARHVPNGVRLAELGFVAPEARTSPNVLFVGLMDHPPNERAAEMLATQIMPLVWLQRPDAKLVLCGANPSRAVLRLAGPRVSVTGRVPSTAPFLAQARVFANCLSYGAGSSLKVLEALASGVPLVSTQAGVRGFALRPEEHYIAAESANDFAGAILRCLEAPLDAADVSQRTRAGRAFAESHSWASLAERFAALASSAADGGKREPISVPAPRS